MKLKKLFIVTLFFALCACTGNSTGAKTEEIVFPFEELKTEYSTGTKKWEASSEDLNGSIATALEEISTSTASFLTFIDSNSEGIDSGRKFYELDGYEESAKDFYEIGCKLANVKSSDLPEEYSAVAASLQSIGKNITQSMEEMYTADSDTATNLCNQMAETLVSAMQELPLLIPKVEVTVAIGETITEPGFAEITITDISYRTRITPSDTSGAYSYYEVKNENDSYLAIRFDFTNLQTQAVYDLDDQIKFLVEYDGGYQYTGWGVSEDGNYLSSYPNLIPLTTFDSWFVIEVPNKLKDSSYKLTMLLGDSEYTVVTE